MVFLSHIQSISDEYKLIEEIKCEVCDKQAEYKLITKKKII